ncbi:MAG: hypothetical protein JRJ58_21950, partial [Deltaproteobacteria bacterium]|nr:hypothetical protein [Deltaproteobacteria bacterium]
MGRTSSNEPGKGLGAAAALLVSTCLGLFFAIVFVMLGTFNVATLRENVAHASSGETQVATSVCDAHRLRALHEDDPSITIEIPAEFDKQFPTASACESHDLAEDVEALGPMQPIPFSHKHHAGKFK